MISNKTIVAIAVVMMLLPLVYSVVRPAFSQYSDETPFLELPEGMDECLPEFELPEGVTQDKTTYMRYHHMHLLKDIRDQAVRDPAGKRKRRDIGLRSCSKCHTSQENFCNRCHEAVNLYLKCFECHDY